MKAMLVVLVIFCFNQFSISAQSASLFVDSLKIYPGSPTENDSVTFIAYTVHPTSDDAFFDKHVVKTDTLITIYSCWVTGVEFINEKKNDTTGIGKLPAGNYRIRYVLRSMYTWELDSVDACLTNHYYDSTFLNFNVASVNSINDPIDDSGFRLFPIPTNGRLTMQVIDISVGKLCFQIISIDGRVLRQSVSMTESDFEIDVSYLSPGVYFFQLQDEEHRWIKKFVKQ